MARTGKTVKVSKPPIYSVLTHFISSPLWIHFWLRTIRRKIFRWYLQKQGLKTVGHGKVSKTFFFFLQVCVWVGDAEEGKLILKEVSTFFSSIFSDQKWSFLWSDLLVSSALQWWREYKLNWETLQTILSNYLLFTGKSFPNEIFGIHTFTN